jgi:hypothetical protein
LEEIVADGALDSFSVTSWAKRVPAEGEETDAGSTERALYERFRAWARSEGVRLTPGFDTRECYSATTGTQQTQVVMPAACLALYDQDGALLGITPHETETGTMTINDGLNRVDDRTTTDEQGKLLTAD